MKKVVSIIAIMLLIFSFTYVQAADEKKLEFKSDKMEINKGEKITLTISSNELTGIEGTLKFESNDWILESKSSNNSFTVNEETGKFALANISGEEKISATITLKSKEDTKAESSTIVMSGIKGSNKSGEGFDISDKKVVINFKKEVNNQDPINEIPDKQTPNKETPKKETVQNKPVATEKIPYTGSFDMFIVFTIVGVVAIVSYIGYKKYNF